jgi:hypothetical protein
VPPPYPDSRRAAFAVLNQLLSNRAAVRIVHYACESLDDVQAGNTPRITSIAVRRLDSAQTELFSIMQEAELVGIDHSDIEQHYDDLERALLDSFYSYVKNAGEVKYVHWNMRDATFGFAALEHRLRTLGGNPVAIPETSRVDLSRLLLDIYGTAYIAHPRLKTLSQKNGITMLRFLPGSEEAQKFRSREYVALQQSTLRKVDVLADVAERAHRGTLKTDSSWWTQNAGSLRAFWDWMTTNASILFILAVLSLVVSVVFGLVGFYIGAHIQVH